MERHECVAEFPQVRKVEYPSQDGYLTFIRECK